MLIINQLKGFRTPRYRSQEVKGSRVQAKASKNKHLNPRILEPLNPYGFTLIELIVAMIIIGILAAIVIPRSNFATSSKALVDGAANMVASDIRYAQECAMATRTSKTVTFSGGNSYSFSPTNTLDPSGRLPDGASTTALTLKFNSLGEPISITGSSVSIGVSDGVQTRTITVLNYTGKVSY